MYKTVGVMLVAGCSQKTLNPEKWEEGQLQVYLTSQWSYHGTSCVFLRLAHEAKMLLIPTGKIDKVSIKSDKCVEPTETINLSSLITKTANLLMFQILLILVTF